MRRDTGQLSLNFMTMIHGAAGSSVYVLWTKTGHRETENMLYTKNNSFISSSCCRYDSDIRFYDLLVQSPLKFQCRILKIPTSTFSFRTQTSQNDPFLHIIAPDGYPTCMGHHFSDILTNKLLSPATLVPSLRSSEL